MRCRLNSLCRGSRAAPAHPRFPAAGAGDWMFAAAAVGQSRQRQLWLELATAFGFTRRTAPHSKRNCPFRHSGACRVCPGICGACKTARRPIHPPRNWPGITELISGIVPTLLLGVGILSVTTGAEAAGGAALGLLGGGIGAVPGGMWVQPQASKLERRFWTHLASFFSSLTFRTSCRRSTTCYERV